MDTSSLKTTAFGGYDKKSVHDFLEELSSSNAVRLTEIAEEKGELMDKIAVLEKTVASLEEKLGASEQEKDHVAKAIVSAEKEAAKILSDALNEAEKIRSIAKTESERLIEDTKSDLKDEFDKIKDLRISTLQAMTQYKDKLDAISKRLGVDE